MGNIRGGMSGFLGTIGQPTAQVIDGSLRFDSSNKNYLTRTPGTASNNKTFTFSAWTKGLGDGTFFCNGVASTGDNGLYIMITSNSFYVGTWTTSWQWYVDTNRLFRDNGWYHLVVSVDTTQSTASDRVKLYVNGVQETSFATANYPSQNYDTLINNTAAHAIGRQGELDSGYIGKKLSQFYWIDGQALGPEYFGFTDPLTNTWRPKKFSGNYTIAASGTVYSSYGSGTVNGSRTYDKAFDGSTSTFCEPSDNQTITFDFTSLSGGGITVGSSLRMYLNKAGTPAAGHFTVNGTNLGGSVPSGGWLTINSVSRLDTITFYHQSGSSSVELYAVEVDGSILTDGTAAQGANSFYLPMDNQDNFEKDKSGKGNDWTKNNFSGTSINPDVLKDSPSSAVFGGRAQTGITTTSSAPANYATLNPLVPHSGTLSDGNLSFAGGSAAWCKSVGTFQIPSSGKYYFEGIITGSGAASHGIGLAEDVAGSTESDLTTGDDYYCVVNNTSTTVNKVSNASATSLGSIGAFSQNDVFGVAVDGSTKEIWIHKNNTYFGSNTPSGTALLTGSGNLFPAIWGYNTNGSWDVNFGQKPFKYAPPQGYLPLNSATARPNKVIARPDQYVGISTWTGNGSTQTISDLNNSPDFVWIKGRSSPTGDHALFDSVRGATKRIRSNTTAAENTDANTLTSFNSNGFSLGSSSAVNNNTKTFVGWAWKAGGNKNTFNVDDVGYASAAAAGLDGGDLTVTGASVGTKQGFSIIKYTGSGNAGDSASHGLLEAPKFIITKNIDNGTYSWRVFTTVIDGSNDRLFLDGTNAKADQTDAPVPTSSVFYVGANLDHNKSNDNIIAYLWHDVPGLQKFGKYTGNASSDGPFVETGMKPALVVFKKTSASGDAWLVYDATRDTHNPTAKRLFWNTTGIEQESNDYAIDIYSNGFKIRTSDGSWNASGATFIYMAWAEAPASNLFGGQSNAR